MNRARVSTFAPTSGSHARAGHDVPTGRHFILLLEALRATGGTAPGEVVAKFLTEYRADTAPSLAELIDTGQVFGFEWRATLWIPMFQFDARDLALKSGAQRVRAELPSQWSGWTLASWFARPNARLDGRIPADMLDSDLPEVMRAACLLGSVREVAPVLPRQTQAYAARL